MTRLLDSIVTMLGEFFHYKSDELEDFVPDLLARLGECSASELAFLAVFPSASIQNFKVYNWAQSGSSSGNLSAAKFDRNFFYRSRWLLARSQGQYPIVINGPGDWPSEASLEREQCRRLGITSLLAIPLFRADALLGFMGLAQRGDSADPWNQDQIAALKVSSLLVLNALEQSSAEEILKSQEANMAATARMSALGEMAGGIAHEINNPLAIIGMNAELLKEQLAQETVDRKSLLESVEKIQKTSHRIAKIVRSLRAFAREGATDPLEMVPLRNIVSDCLDLCAEKFRNRGILLHVGEVPEDLRMECRQVEVSQVILNLLNNAYDAIETMPKRWIRLEVVECGDLVEFRITDSGRGITPELRERVFRPFFTTKGVGKGTGLGLSISKGIVETYHGYLKLIPWAENTQFVVAFPKTQSLVKRLEKEGVALVVDSSRLSREKAADVLGRFGFHEILTLKDWAEARNAVSTQKPHLILGEWISESLESAEFLKWIRTQSEFSSTAFVVHTSDALKESVQAAVDAGADEYLLKPLGIAQVQSRVFRALLKRRVFNHV